MEKVLEHIDTKDAERIDLSNNDFDKVEVELEALSKKEALRINIDTGLENALKEMEELESQMPKEQGKKLLELCEKNVLDTVLGQFGLGSWVLDAQDGGNVNTTRNVRKGIYANEKEKRAYENRGEYISRKYHSHEKYKEINKKQGELKEEGRLKDYMTGKTLDPNTETHLDHIVAAKTIHDDGARVLAEADGLSLANKESNLKMTDASLNMSKKAKTADEFLARRDERIRELKRVKEKRGYLTESEQKEQIKLDKQKEINDEEFRRQYDESKKEIDSKVDKAYYTSSKPY